MNRLRVAGILIVVPLVLALTASSCDRAATGVVSRKYLIAKPLIFVLVIKQADGTKVKVHPHRSSWRRCHVGARYPECTIDRKGR